MLSGQTDGWTPERVEPMRMDRTHLSHTLGPNLEPPLDPPARAGPGPRWPLPPSSLGFCVAVRPEALHRGRCSGRPCLTPGPSFPLDAADTHVLNTALRACNQLSRGETSE